MEFRGQGVQILHIRQPVRIRLRLVKCLNGIKVKSVVVSHNGCIALEFTLFADQIIAQGNKGNGEKTSQDNTSRHKTSNGTTIKQPGSSLSKVKE